MFTSIFNFLKLSLLKSSWIEHFTIILNYCDHVRFVTGNLFFTEQIIEETDKFLINKKCMAVRILNSY